MHRFGASSFGRGPISPRRLLSPMQPAMPPQRSPQEMFRALVEEAEVLNRTVIQPHNKQMRRRLLADVAQRMVATGCVRVDGRSPTRVYLKMEDGTEKTMDLDLHAPKPKPEQEPDGLSVIGDDGGRLVDPSEFFNLPGRRGRL